MLLLCEWVELDLQLFNRKLMHAPSPKPLLLSDILHRKQEVEEYPHVTCASNKNPLLLLILCVCLCVCVCVCLHMSTGSSGRSLLPPAIAWSSPRPPPGSLTPSTEPSTLSTGLLPFPTSSDLLSSFLPPPLHRSSSAVGGAKEDEGSS